MRHILIIDGDEGLLNQYEFSFQRVKYHVTTADSGETGLLKVEQTMQSAIPLTCILVDIELPGMTGIEFIKAIRGKGIDIPLVTLSFSVNKEMLIKLMRWDCADFCEKPLSFGELYLRVDEAVKRRSLFKKKYLSL